MDEKKLRVLFSELKGYSENVPKYDITEQNIWEEYNGIIFRLEELVKEDYSRFKVTPKSERWSNGVDPDTGIEYGYTIHTSVDLDEYKSKLSSILKVLKTEIDALNKGREDSSELQKTSQTKMGTYSYINVSRVQELQVLSRRAFDFQRLIKLCEELNDAFERGNYLSAGLLVRVIIDHIPPIFGKQNFTEVANNYGGDSFKQSMQHLNISSRKIADSLIHTQIRRSETLPTSNQVDFTNDLDRLLEEIIRVSR